MAEKILQIVLKGSLGAGFNHPASAGQPLSNWITFLLLVVFLWLKA